MLGRPLLNLKSEFEPEFSQDGRIVIRLEDQLILYQVKPALEYRTLAHASREPVIHGRRIGPARRTRARCRHGLGRGARDLARGTELAFLSIANAPGDVRAIRRLDHQRLDGRASLAIRLDVGRRDFGIGPPLPLRLPAGPSGIAQDRSGRIVAKASVVSVHIATPERSFWIGGLNECRGVAVSPDGRIAGDRHSIRR